MPVGVAIELGGQPFSQAYLLAPGLGLSLMMASLLIQCFRIARRPRSPAPWKQLYLLVGIGLCAWVAALAVEDFTRWSRDDAERIAHTAQTNSGNVAAAVEWARLEAINGNPAQAEALLLNAERAASWYGEFPYAKAELLLLRGDAAAAQFYAEQLLQKDPNDPRARALLDASERQLTQAQP
ncbi:MAG: tetratricopeptide repeat protein [Puniceicoccales bacterium]